MIRTIAIHRWSSPAHGLAATHLTSSRTASDGSDWLGIVGRGGRLELFKRLPLVVVQGEPLVQLLDPHQAGEIMPVVYGG